MSAGLHEPQGCNLVHPFTLRPNVDWAQEPADFSVPHWAFTKSTIRNWEFRRFQHGNLFGILIPVNIMVATDFLYPLYLVPGQFSNPFIFISLVLGVALFVTLSVCVYGHLRASWKPIGVRSKQLVEVLLLINLAATSGYFAFDLMYNKCNTFVEPLGNAFGRNTTVGGEQGWTPERNMLYCQQIVHPYTALTLIVGPVTTNLPPIVVRTYIVIRVINELVNRPIAYAVGAYNPPEAPGMIVSQCLVLFFLAILGERMYWLRNNAVLQEFQQTVVLSTEILLAKAKEEHVDLLLCATVPPSALDKLASNLPCGDYASSATVLFSDMVSFTTWSSQRQAQEVVRMLNIVTEAIDLEAIRLNVEKIKTIGDAYWAVTGLPEPLEEQVHAGSMLQFALEMLKVVRRKGKEHLGWGQIQFRIGVHSGPLSGGILGNTTVSYEVFGETCDVASKVEQNGSPSHVVVTQATAAAAGSSTLHTQFIEFGTMRHAGVEYQLLLFNDVDDDATGLDPSEDVANLVMMDADAEDNLRGARAGPGGSPEEASIQSSFSARSVQNPHEGQMDEGKARRKAFLAQRAAGQRKKEQDLLKASLSFSDIEERCTRRKWRWLLSTLADAQSEQDFVAFTLTTQQNMRLWTRLALVLMPLLILVAVAVEQSRVETPSPTAVSIAFLLLSFAVGVVDLTFYYSTAILKKGGPERPGLHAVLAGITCIFVHVAAIFTTPGTSITLNDPGWTWGCMILFGLLGNYGAVDLVWLMLGWAGFTLPPVWVSTYNTQNFGIIRSIEAQVVVGCALMFSVQQRQLRQQFFQIRLQEYFKQEQLKRVAEQDALLKSIVPEHISGVLLTWMAGDMVTPLVRRYSSCAVSFFHLQPPPPPRVSTPMPVAAEVLEDAVGGGEDPGDEGDLNPLLKGPQAAEARDTQFDNSSESRHQGGGEEMLSIMPPHPPLPPLAQGSLSWQADAITQVDSLLGSSHHKTISKVKTIGDVVMLAGPFRYEDPEFFQTVQDVETPIHDLRDAVTELVELARGLAGVTGGVHAGIHVGPLVGAIQGTNRLCYDIFGDTVNVASRVMSGCAKLERPAAVQQAAPRNAEVPLFCSVSEDAKRLLVEEELKDDSQESTLSAIRRKFKYHEAEVLAKGKGLLKVHFVV